MAHQLLPSCKNNIAFSKKPHFTILSLSRIFLSMSMYLQSYIMLMNLLN